MIVYLNGEFIPLEQAFVPVLDRGFIFGDGVYEVIPVYNRKLLRLDQHISRLERNLKAIRMPVTVTAKQWHDILQQLLQENTEGDVAVYIQITRGVAPRDHSLPENITPTILAMCNPLTPVPPKVKSDGVAVITQEDIRWKNCHIKVTSLLPNVLLKQQAVDAGATEVILIRDGEATEGSVSNLFVVKDNVLLTPPKTPNLLPGVTRDLVLELAGKHDLEFKEQIILEEMLPQADEIWLTSSTKDVLPVTSLNGNKVGTGKPGPMWLKMNNFFQNYKQSL